MSNAFVNIPKHPNKKIKPGRTCALKRDLPWEKDPILRRLMCRFVVYKEHIIGNSPEEHATSKGQWGQKAGEHLWAWCKEICPKESAYAISLRKEKGVPYDDKAMAHLVIQRCHKKIRYNYDRKVRVGTRTREYPLENFLEEMNEAIAFVHAYFGRVKAHQ